MTSRSLEQIKAEQKAHDCALTKAAIAFFASLLVGGIISVFVMYNPLLHEQRNLKLVLVSVFFVLPLSASLIALTRVPPAPPEMLEAKNAERLIDQRQKQWRMMLLSQILVIGSVALQAWSLSLRLPPSAAWVGDVASATPVILVVLLGVAALYAPPGFLNARLRATLDDEVTRNLRARALRLGYLLMLLIMGGFGLYAQVNAPAAARYLPMGLAAGVIIPSLYFVFLDWRASRS